MPAPWTCRTCLRRQLLAGNPHSLGYSTKSRPPLKWSRRKWTVVLAAAGGSFGAGTLAFSDDARHWTTATKRTGRVVSVLLVNINEADGQEKQASLLKACHKRCAERTLEALEQNGSIFIKLGQHLSSMEYLLPSEWTRTFVPLQDKCPVSSIESIEGMFVKDTGMQITELFADFEREPVGAASLAQVHRATMKDTGQRVAVKVQHPALEEWVPLDMRLTKMTFAAVKYFFPDYDLEWLSDEMESSLPQELDFAQEGENAIRAREYFKGIQDTPLVIPDVLWAKKRILVMEYISGHRPDDLEYLDTNNIDRDEVSAALSRIFNEMIFGDNAPLHCDPHGGNIAIRKTTSSRKPNFDVILYDHGLYRDIPKELKRSYAKLWLAVIDADETRMRKYAYDVAGITEEQFPLFASAITGRDYRVVTKSVNTPRSDQEREDISDALGEGMLQQLVQLLGKVPRIILLILKTNDLTRSLDENLHTRQGPAHTFLILARYCSRTVFGEQMEEIRRHGSLYLPCNLLRLLSAWASYMRVEWKLSLYEYYISVRRHLGVPVSVGLP
ncbi:MAG: hypothetical protein M1836_004897 [Candelina mexicana]|nr:MAG: hypothetical protein M1836_004897 [Candelina mexicana]